MTTKPTTEPITNMDKLTKARKILRAISVLSGPEQALCVEYALNLTRWGGLEGFATASRALASLSDDDRGDLLRCVLLLVGEQPPVST